MKTLEQITSGLIAEVQLEFDERIKNIHAEAEKEFEQQVFKNLPQFSFIKNNTVFMNATNMSDLKEILSKVPATNEETLVERTGRASAIPTPYKLDTKSTINEGGGLIITYDHDKYNVRVFVKNINTLPQKWFNRVTRKVTDSELHYFEGCSHEEIDQIQIPAHKFANATNLTWYGGNYTCWESEIVDAIIQEILDTK